MNHGMYDEQELSFEEAGLTSLAGASEWEAEKQYKAQQEREEYLAVLASGE